MIRHSLKTDRPGDLGAFESLVYPIDLDAFFADIWRKQILLIDGEGAPPLPLIDTDQFLTVLYEAGLGSMPIRYTTPGVNSAEANRDAFFRLKAKWERPPSLSELAVQTAGGTLVFDAIAGRVPRAKAWCREIFKAKKLACDFNAYFGSSEGASAVGAHFDLEDVFILQVEGQKDWHLWEAPEPSTGLTWSDCETPTAPPDQIVRLSPGDILYVPRRRWHWPKTVGDGASFHLTLQVVPLYAKDIARWIESLLQGDEALERGISYALSSPDDQPLGAGMKKAIALLQSELEKPDAAGRAELFLTMRRMKQVFADKGA